MRLTCISIHALLAEGDSMSAVQVLDAMLFLSTPSSRRATICPLCEWQKKIISIHALLAEGD